MIVFDLQCDDGHVFEAWFGSSGDYADQQKRGLVSCPVCGVSSVRKAVMAPNVSAKGNRQSGQNAVPVMKEDGPSPGEVKAVIAALAKAQSEMLSKSRWVGRDFDKKARAMDAGEIDKATIHGEVTPQQAQALIDDEISVVALPFPVVPPNEQN